MEQIIRRYSVYVNNKAKYNNNFVTIYDPVTDVSRWNHKNDTESL